MRIDGKKLEAIRKKKGLSVERLSQLLSLPKDLILAYENNNRNPDEQNLASICLLLNIDKEDLLITEKNEEPLEKKVEILEKGKFLGTCARCGKTIYSNDKYGLGEVRKTKKKRRVQIQYIYDAEINEGSDYLCAACCEEIMALKSIAEDAESKRLRKKLFHSLTVSLIFGLVLGFVAFIPALYFFMHKMTLQGLIASGISIGIAYYLYSFAMSLSLNNNWIANMTLGFARVGYLTLPSAISSHDVQGVLKNIFVKIIFFAIYLAFITALYIVLLAFLGLASMLAWPFFRLSLQREIASQESKKSGLA